METRVGLAALGIEGVLHKGRRKSEFLPKVLAALSAECKKFPETCRAEEECVKQAVEAAVKTSVVIPVQVLMKLFGSMVSWKVSQSIYRKPGEFEEEEPTASNPETTQASTKDLSIQPMPSLKRQKCLRHPFIWVYIDSEPFVGYRKHFDTNSVRPVLDTLATRLRRDRAVSCPPPATLLAYVHSQLWAYSLALNMGIALQLAMVFNAPHIHFKYGLTVHRELKTADAELTALEEIVLSASDSPRQLGMGLSNKAAKELRPRIVRNGEGGASGSRSGTRKYLSRSERVERQKELEIERETYTTYIIALAKAFVQGAPFPNREDHLRAKHKKISRKPTPTEHLVLEHSTHMDAMDTRVHTTEASQYQVLKTHFFPAEIVRAIAQFKSTRTMCEAITNIDRAYMHRVKDLLLKAMRRTTVVPCSIKINNVICTLYAERTSGANWPPPGRFYQDIMEAMKKIISGVVTLPQDMDIKIQDLSLRDTTRAETTANTLQAMTFMFGRECTVRLGQPNTSSPNKPLAVHSSFSSGSGLIPVAAALMATLLQTAGFTDARITLPNSSPKVTGQATMTLPFAVNDAAPIFQMGKNPGAQLALRAMTNYTADDHGRSQTLPPWMVRKSMASKLNSGIRFKVFIGTRVTSVAIHRQSLVLTGKSDAHDFTVAAISVCLQLYQLSGLPWAIQPLEGCTPSFAGQCIKTMLETNRTDLPTFGIGSPCLTLALAPPNALRIVPDEDNSVLYSISRAVCKSNEAAWLKPEPFEGV